MRSTLPLVAATLLLTGQVRAHDNDGVPSRDELVDELRGINQQLRNAQLKLGDDQTLDRSSAAHEISRAQIAFFEEDYPLAAIRLFRLVARPGIERHPGYPEALSWLGESLWAMGLRKSAVQNLREALSQPRQTSSAYRRMLARYLAVAGDVESLDEVRTFWRRYQSLRGNSKLELADRDARYHYAKALFRGGALAESDALFGAVDEDDPHHLKARYFVGVIRLARDDVKGAKKAFLAALEAYERTVRPTLVTATKEREYLPDAYDHGGPLRELVKLELDEEALLPDEETRAHQRLGAVIHLALARLAAYEDKDHLAWHHYRQVPRGSADFAEALSEASFVVYRIGGQLSGAVDIDTDGDHSPDASERELAYRWSARLIDQLLSGRGDDISGAQLELWKAQLFAKATDYERARATYRRLDEALRRRSEELEAQIAQEKTRMFPQSVLAWTAPDDANRARMLEADLVTQREALAETVELVEVLEALLKSSELLPAITSARELKAKLVERLVIFDRRLKMAADAAYAHQQSPDERGLHNGGPPASVADVQRLQVSARRLYARLEGFGRDLDLYERRFRTRLRDTLKAEAPEVRRLVSTLDRELRSADRLGVAMRNSARANLENTAAEAFFGQVDIAFWRKEEISQRILDVLRDQNDLQARTRRVESQMEAPPPRVPWAPAEGEGEAERDGAPADEEPPPEDDAEVPLAKR